jgi:hypothetical protein
MTERTEMTVEDWEVWQTYATRFVAFPFGMSSSEAVPDIGEAARRLCKSGICPAVFMSFGFALWQENGEVQVEDVQLDRAGHEQTGTFEMPQAIMEARPYVLEAVGQAAQMRFQEMILHGDYVQDSMFYLRGYLDPCFIGLEGNERVLLYPHIKLYSNGVLLLSFRMLSPETPLAIDEVVDRHVNLFAKTTRHAEAPPNVLRWSARDTILSLDGNPLKRYTNLKALGQVIEDINAASYEESFPAFTHEFVSLDPKGVLEDERLNLDSLRASILEAVSGALNQPRAGRDYLLRGPREKKYQLSNEWRGRPNVHLIRFQDQPSTASEVRHDFGDALAKVLSRMPTATEEHPAGYVTQSLRPHEDLSMHVNEAVSVWAYARQRIEKHPDLKSENAEARQSARHDLIFGEQVKAELMESVHQSYRSLEERAFRSVETMGDAYELMEERLVYDKIREKPAVYGELMEMYQSCWEAFGTDRVVEAIDRNLDLSTKKAAEKRDKRIRRFGWLIAIVFGLAGVRGMSKGLVAPLWKETGLWVPSSANLETAFYYCCSAAVIAIVVAVAWQMLEYRSGP